LFFLNIEEVDDSKPNDLFIMEASDYLARIGEILDEYDF
jgi:hypothetical protein